MTDAYARATLAYRASGNLIRDPASIAAALHRMLYAAIMSARLADEQNRLDEMTNHVQEACRLLTALRFHMNFDAAGPAGAELSAFYARLQRQILATAMLRDRSKRWDNVAEPIRSILVNLSQHELNKDSPQSVSTMQRGMMTQ